MNTNIQNPIQDIRPTNKKKLSSEKLTRQLRDETDLAWHEVKIFCIKNCIWLIALMLLIVAIVVIDLTVVFGVWKNPVILFEQIKKLWGYVIVYILGLVTDHIKKMITKS